ncbi:hypothetical protein GCM10023185_43180 [Hymenobacter saemangeumensis]|uniref:Ig-like domain-containing protein n=1 Tax=Hymenobacter saemangeumensis TaxID=1084522 RepID=A0ABP8IRW1_9BACT
MLTPLLRQLRGLPLLLLVLAFFAARPAQASHFLGGELSYRYLDATGPAGTPFRYEITAVIYINAYAPDMPAPANPFLDLSLYNKSQGNQRFSAIQIPRVSLSAQIAPPTPGNCQLPSPPRPFQLAVYRQTVNLPVSFDGYYAVLVANARNLAIDNINASNNNTPLTLYLDVAPPLIPNRSPVFADTAVAVICQGDTAVQLNSAVDPDGDRLVYAFGAPSGAPALNTFTPPPASVPYFPNHSVTQPFGPGGFASINATTGLARYRAVTQGEYVIAIDVSEYRTINGTEVLLGTTRRDLQLVVRPCPPNTPPQLPPSTGGASLPRNYIIEEGQSVTIPFSATDPNNDPLVLQLNSVLLDGPGATGFNAALNGNQGTVAPGNVTGTAQVTGTGSVSGTFVYSSRCGDARSTPYSISVTVQDRGCGGQTIADVFTIQVNRAAGPSGITGSTVVCDPATLVTYTAAGPTATSYNWQITGGTIVSGQGTNTIQVRWNSTPNTGTLRLNGVSAFGCPSTAVTTNVDIRPLAALSVTPSAPTICRGASTTLTVTGAAGLTYTWTGGSQPMTGSSITVSPQNTTVYTVTGTDGTCSTSQQVTVSVTQASPVSPNPSATLCSGATATLGGITPVAGVTYSWSPTTGLNDPTSPNPTITLTNNTSAPVTINYTVTSTTAQGCTSTATVAVTVNPRPLADAGPDVSQCGTITRVLGTPAIAGNTYSWSPTTGLSNPNIAQPTVTLTNSSTSANLSVTYTLTVRSANNCAAADAVIVTVFPGTVDPNPTLTLCSGSPGVLAGVTPVAGTTYLWSPATGLSDPTSPTPTITLTNNTASPTTQVYTLSATTNGPLGGCTATASVTVTVNPLPLANAGPALATCSGVTSAPLGSPAVAGTTYSWSPSTGLSNPNIAQPTVTGTNNTGAPISTTYTLTATSSANCTATSTVVVTINPAAVANPGPAVSFCSGSSAQIGTAALAGTTYSWSPATGLSSTTAAQPTVTGTNTTGAPISTTYTLTATTANNCTATSTVVVTINPAAVANPGPAVTVCSGIAAQLGVAPVAGTTYAWTPTMGLSDPTAANPTVTLTNTTGAPISTTYTLTATTANNCVATATVTVTVNPAAVANPGPAVSFCSGGSAQLGVAPVAGTTYSWSPSTGLSDPTAANPTVSGTNTTGAPISTTYTLTATTANGCVTTNTVVVTINQAAVANAGLDQAQCVGFTGQIGMMPVAGTTYSWSPATGLSNPNIANPVLSTANTTASIQVLTYTLTATTAQGCSATDEMQLTLYPAAVADAGPAVSFCSGGSAQLGGAPTAGTVYSWSPTTGLSDPTAANPTITLTNTTGAPITTTYTLTASVTNPGGNVCTASSTVAVTVNQAAVANPGPAIAFCGGVPTQLGVAPVAGTTYSWTPTAGLNDPTLANPLVTLPNTTGAPITTTYTLTATTAQGCSATSTVTLTINPEAVADTGNPQSICSGGTVQLGAAPIAGTTYSWTQSSGPAAPLSNPNIANPTATLTNTTGSTITYIYTLTATTANGCVATRGVRIDVFPAAVASTGSAVTICSGGSTQLGAAPIAGTTYSWSPATGLSDPTASNPTVTLTNTTNAPITTTYTLTATTANGCVATASVAVTVNPASVVDAGADRAVCADVRTTLGSASQTGYTYSWTPAAGLSSATAAQPVLNTAGLNTTMTPLTLKYYLTATTPQGCVGRDSVEVTINPRPAAVGIVGSASVCPTVTGVAYSVLNPTGTAYQWIVAGGTIASGQGTTAITVDWGMAGNGSVKLFHFNSFGCSSDTTTLPVLINQQLQTPTPTGPGNVLATAPNNSVCQAGGPYTYASQPYTNGSLYSWTIIGGTQVSTNLNTVTVSWNPVTVPTIGKIVVTETSNPASGVRCLGTSDTLRVLINPTPLSTLTLNGPARVCQGGSVTFTLPGGFAGSSYAFQLGGSPVTGSGNSVTLASQNTPGTYTLTAQETSAQGCAGPVYTATFTVDPTPAQASITGSRFVCNISLPLQYSVPNTPGSTYTWNVTGGTITAGQNSSQVTVSFTPGQTTYRVSVSETSTFGCGGPTTSITVLPDNPSVALSIASVDLTSNNRVLLTFSAPNSGNTPNQVRVMRRDAGMGSFVFVGNVAPSATTYTDNTVNASTKSYEYQLELTNGCGTLLQSPIVQTILLQATATPGTGGRNQGDVALRWNAYVGFPVQQYQIFRRDDNGSAVLVNTVSGTTLTANLPNPGTGFNQCYRVVALGANNQASNSNESCVDFANPVAFYNVITPNNDGKNDVLEIDNIKLYPGNSLTIFNRWGREVYSTSNYQNNWGGEGQSAGVYYYLLKLPNGSSTKGWFEIIK